MKITLRADERTTLSLVATDASGNPAELDGVPSWSVQGTGAEAVQLTPSEDGMSAELVTTGPVGVAQVVVSADARLGEEVRLIEGLLDVEVVAGEAMNLQVSASPPEKR